MSGIMGVGLQLAMGVSLIISASMNTGDGLQDNVNWDKQDAYFQDVLPKVISYDPKSNVGVGFDNNVPFRYYSVNLKNLRFVNQQLSHLQYEVLEVRDNAGNDVAVIKTLETMNEASPKIQIKVSEDVMHENLKSARFRLIMTLPIELKRATVPLKEGSYTLGEVTVKIGAILKGSRTSTSTINDWTITEEHATTTVSYSQDKSASTDTNHLHLLGFNDSKYLPIFESWKSFGHNTKNYHVTFEGELSQLELIDPVSMKLFSYDIVMDFKTGEIMID